MNNTISDHISRRRLMRYAGGCALTSALAMGGAPFAVAQPAALRVRRDIAELAAGDPDVSALRRGIAEMKALSAADPNDPRGWERQKLIHAVRAQHGNWYFLPWHRIQLHYFERLIAAFSGKQDFALPYWDWRTSPTIPPYFWDTSSSLYLEDRLPGRSDKRNYDFKRANAARNFGRTDLKARDPWSIIGTPRGYGGIDRGGHGWVHVAVGGKLGDPATATLDPLFWLHHCNVDRVWETININRQDINNGVPTSPPRLVDWSTGNTVVGNIQDWLEEDFVRLGHGRFNVAPFIDDDGAPATMRVADCVVAADLGFRYDLPFPGDIFEARSMGEGAPPQLKFERSLSANAAAMLIAGAPTIQTIRIDSETRNALNNIGVRDTIEAEIYLPAKFNAFENAALQAYFTLGAPQPTSERLAEQVHNCFAVKMVSQMQEEGAILQFDGRSIAEQLIEATAVDMIGLVIEALPARDELTAKCSAQLSAARMVLRISG